LYKPFQDGNSVPSQLASAYAAFSQYCKAKRLYPLVKHFTKDNTGWTSMRAYPECSWKGSDTRLLLGFLVAHLERPQVQVRGIASSVYIALRAIDDFLRTVFGEKDERGCRLAMWTKCMAQSALAKLELFLNESYKRACLCHAQRLCFFNLTPKFHYLGHICVDMNLQLQQEDLLYVLNPGLFATQMAEDATGRSCRMARTCHARTSSLRVAQKWLIACKLFWEEDKEKESSQRMQSTFT